MARAGVQESRAPVAPRSGSADPLTPVDHLSLSAAGSSAAGLLATWPVLVSPDGRILCACRRCKVVQST